MQETKYNPTWRSWLKIGRLVPLLTILTATVVGILSFLGHFQVTMAEVVIIALLTLLSFDALVERLSLLEKIDTRLEKLPKPEQLFSSNILLQSAQQCGLMRIHARSREAHDELLQQLESSTRQVDLQGLTISDLVHKDEWLRIMKQRIASGIQVRIVIISPENPSLAPGGKHAYREVDLLRTQAGISWNKLVSFYEQLPQKDKKRISIYRLEYGIMSFSLRRFDSTMYVVHYLTHHNTPETPLYVIQGEDRLLFRKCLEEFETNIARNAKKL
jgi:hypothetical protein